MKIFIVTFGVMIISIIGMAVGVLLSNRELKGSCGGLNKLIGEDCMFCEKKDECKENPSIAEECLDTGSINA